MDVGAIIRAKRKEAGLTQKELASKIGVAQNTIAHYETGIRTPKLNQLTEIAKALNLSATTFLSEENDKPLRRTAKMTSEEKRAWLQAANPEDLLKQFETSADNRNHLFNHAWLTADEIIEDYSLVRAELLSRLNK